MSGPKNHFYKTRQTIATFANSHPKAKTHGSGRTNRATRATLHLSISQPRSNRVPTTFQPLVMRATCAAQKDAEFNQVEFI